MVLRKVYRKDKGYEWALVSKSSGKVLQWFGPKRPVPSVFMAAERRVQYFKNLRKAHFRRTNSGKLTSVKSHTYRRRPQAIGSSWKGKRYMHGPRRVSPKQIVRYYTTPPNAQGVRRVMGKTRSGKWVQQSTLRPIVQRKRSFESIPTFARLVSI